MHDLLRVGDLTKREFIELLDLAAKAKADPGFVRGSADGRSVAIIFEKPSLRTRFSVESALARIGAHPIGAYDREVGLGSRESLDDAGRVLSRYVDAIVIRTFEHARIEELAEAASVPVINALSDAHHPLQALADVMTIVESCCGGDIAALPDIKVAYVGDGNNVAASLIEACELLGIDIALACPAGHEPARDATVVTDPAAAVADADVVYTDVWTSMGQEDEAAARKAIFEPYRVTAALMAKAKPDAIFLHCLPAHRGEEVDAAVIDGASSRVFDQAENRLHTSLAVFLKTFGGA
jgi:ornithine carbamoyltransferase